MWLIATNPGIKVNSILEKTIGKTDPPPAVAPKGSSEHAIDYLIADISEYLTLGPLYHTATQIAKVAVIWNWEQKP